MVWGATGDLGVGLLGGGGDRGGPHIQGGSAVGSDIVARGGRVALAASLVDGAGRHLGIGMMRERGTIVYDRSIVIGAGVGGVWLGLVGLRSGVGGGGGARGSFGVDDTWWILRGRVHHWSSELDDPSKLGRNMRSLAKLPSPIFDFISTMVLQK